MLLLIFPVLVWPLLSWRRPRWLDFLPLAALTVMLIHLFVEGYRWQMIPAYVLIALVFLVYLPRLGSAPKGTKKRSAWSIASGIGALLIWLLALALATLLPVPQLPEVTGPYAMGTRTFYLVDESRDEIYTADPDDKRELIMQIWYPAAASAEGKPAVYLEELETMAPILAERLGLPSFLVDHINLVEMDVQQDVPILDASAPYPVLVFSHGLRGVNW
jgi:predicted dienelactone hydrolase